MEVSEDEDEEPSAVEEVREKLASLAEFIEQHANFSGSDWELLRLMTLQKQHFDKEKKVEMKSAMKARMKAGK